MDAFRTFTILFVVTLVAGARLDAAGQDSGISGVVADSTGASIANAKVDLVRGVVTVQSAVTNGEGRYRFEMVPPGAYMVRVGAAGFQTSERRVDARASGNLTVDFQLSVQALEESITVTAEAVKAEIEAQRSLTPGGVTIIAAEELYSRQVNNLADMLRFVPGVFAESGYGNDELFFSSRGSNLDAVDYDKNGVKLFQDGLPVTTADGNNHNRVIDPLTARYVTVARGANALTYGASTLGGAIDFVSPTARNSAPLSVFLNGGSHGSLNGRVTVGGAGETVDGLVTIEGREWDGYRDHSNQKRWGVHANAGWQPSPSTSVQLFAAYVDNDIRLPGALTRAELDADPDQASAAALAGDYGKVVKTARVAAKTTWSFGAHGSLSAGLSYEGQSLFHPIVNQIFVDFDGPGPNAPVEVFSLLIDTSHRDLGAMMRYDRRVGAHDLLAGVNIGRGTVEGGNYRNLRGQRNGIAEYVDDRADSLEAFVVDRWRVSNRLTAVVGAQLVSAGRDVRTTNASTSIVSNPHARYFTVNPRAGVIASLNSTGELYGNVSRLFEAPTTFQMQDNVLGGDAMLDPMSGVVVEGGWRSRASRPDGFGVTWDIGAYYARINDEILSMDDPNAPGNSLVTNFESTTHAGIEAVIGANAAIGNAHHVVPQVSLTLNRFRFADDPVYSANRLPAAPTYAARGEVLYRHASGIYVGPTFDFVGERFADLANAYKVDGYSLMGLRTGISGRRWEVFGEVRNLLDTQYIATVSVLNVAGDNARVLYPGAPLSVYAGARFSF